MKPIANYYEEREAELAVEALKHMGIASERRAEETEFGKEIWVSVPEADADRAAEILEKLVELLAGRPAGKAKRCPRCGSEDLVRERQTGHFGDHVIYVCTQCEQAFSDVR